jgi:adenylyltransferase/sulfurtransferase
VEPSNLQRQSLFDERDAAESLPKAIAAERKISAFNSEISVEARVADLVPGNIEDLLEGMDVILDGTDNFETRYLVNDYAVKGHRPWIYAAAVGSYGVTLNILPGKTACLACIFPDTPRGMVETCETSGILNTVVNLVAAVAATEAIKMLLGGEALCQLRQTLWSLDVWTNEQAELARPIDFAEMQRRLETQGIVRHNEFVLKFWREPYEMTLFPDGRAIIKGTTDAGVARSLYARFVGS